MYMRRFAPLALFTSMALAGCSTDATTAPPADRPSLVTHGTLAGAAHPEVVLILMEVDDNIKYRCSGTLISTTVVLTAGHCVGEPQEFRAIRIFTESDVENGANNYPDAGPNSVEARTWSAHPLYTNAAFFLHDVGVIHLAGAVILPASSYGQLPDLNQLDALRPSSRTKFTAVGYGLQRSNPVFVEAEKVRMFATPHLIQINTGFTGGGSLLLSNNARTGGTCFGDSGGPNYLGSTQVIAAVTSFGINGRCAGTGGVFRVDRPDVLAFIQTHLR